MANRFVKTQARAALCALGIALAGACEKRAETPAGRESASPGAALEERTRAEDVRVVPVLQPSPTPRPPELRADDRLAQTVQNFESVENPADRSLLTNEFIALAASGVPSHDVALALGSLVKTEPDTDVRLDILDRLVILDDPDMFFQLANALSPDQPRRVRSTAIGLLENYGDRRIVPLLLQTASTDPDAGIREAAAKAAQSLNEAGL